MNEFQLKYGCNPNQKPSRIFMEDGSDLPVEILNGRPGYINFLDAFNGYQLVKELKKATGLPAATSFKHVSPAGAAVGLPLTDVEKKIYWVDEAIGELGLFIDRCVLNNIEEIRIIHGKGTGVLRTAVGDYLKTHPNVAEYRLGRYGEGENGVTIAKLK